MKIHYRTEEEQRRIGKKGMEILSEDSDIVVKELATRFGVSDSHFIGMMKKYGYRPRRMKKTNENIIDSIGNGT